MTPEFKILISVSIGAVIGLVTNWLALKMIFRPFEAKKIGNFTIPFTPGIIPKDREKLAEKIGNVVGEHLVTADEISKVIKTEHTLKSVENKLDKGIAEVAGPLAGFIPQEMKGKLAVKIIEMIETELPEILEQVQLKEIVREKVLSFPLEDLESLILQVVNKELRYVTYFGGILGGLIGLVQGVLFVI
ncbi:MAG: DUF445 family protein [Calditrichaeota bacterium]|nr:MAG: DUF445 family protein [Calditrichota bacterium]